MSRSEKRTILLVDDDPEIRSALAECLRHAQYEVFEAETGEAALQTVSARALDSFALISDFHMPGLNGGELVKRLREIGTKMTLAVLIPSYDTSPMELMGVDDRSTHVFRKPFSISALVSLLERLYSR